MLIMLNFLQLLFQFLFQNQDSQGYLQPLIHFLKKKKKIQKKIKKCKEKIKQTFPFDILDTPLINLDMGK